MPLSGVLGLPPYNAAHDPDLGSDVGWTPTLHTGIDPAEAVRLSVSQRAGAGRVR
ncbi:hypothetical protein ACWDUI_03690 [Streptosporangium sandarakinum]|uniref:hypothetical protein n=1 Tax=Streptosporangium sandarakinum TaxID=1260955 RepID=UPI00379B53A3